MVNRLNVGTQMLDRGCLRVIIIADAVNYPRAKGLFFCFINGVRFSDHFELRCQGKSDSDLDI
jgi:hypothetical protein